MPLNIPIKRLVHHDIMALAVQQRGGESIRKIHYGTIIETSNQIGYREAGFRMIYTNDNSTRVS
jgi:hypothetical protein